jgi:hypothetical protein
MSFESMDEEMEVVDEELVDEDLDIVGLAAPSPTF